MYVNTIRELCIRKSGRKKRDPSIIQVIGKLASLMTTRVILEKIC
jgi:hypothetical protein